MSQIAKLLGVRSAVDSNLCIVLVSQGQPSFFLQNLCIVLVLVLHLPAQLQSSLALGFGSILYFVHRNRGFKVLMFWHWHFAFGIAIKNNQYLYFCIQNYKLRISLLLNGSLTGRFNTRDL